MNVSIAKVFEMVNAISKFQIEDEEDKEAINEALHILIRVIEPMSHLLKNAVISWKK